jgi:hypothetical protein
VLVYQTLGDVRSEEVANSMQQELEVQLPGSGVKPACMKLKNTIATATGQDSVARFLQTNNLLLGWQLPQHSRLDQLQTSRDTPLKNILQTSSSPSSLQSPCTSLPQHERQHSQSAAASTAQGSQPAHTPAQQQYW